jgi:hypothetical protein
LSMKSFIWRIEYLSCGAILAGILTSPLFLISSLDRSLEHLSQCLAGFSRRSQPLHF